MIEHHHPYDPAALAKLIRPTGTDHTPTPWRAGGEFSIITPGVLHHVATFERTPDRDLALYFANSHAAIIAVVRNMAGAFEFLAGAVPAGTTTAAYCKHQAELGTIYANLFARLGRRERDESG